MGGDVPPPVPTGSHQEYIGYNMKIKLTDKPARGKVDARINADNLLRTVHCSHQSWQQYHIRSEP